MLLAFIGGMIYAAGLFFLCRGKPENLNVGLNGLVGLGLIMIGIGLFILA
jgi:hypothetical protein